MAAATHGASIIFPSEAFNALATLEAVREHKATALYGVPTMFVAELDLLAHGAVPHDGFQHLRTGIAAGSSVPAELMRKLHKQLNLTELTICYGMTETSPVSCMTTTDDPIEKRINTVGKLLPHVSAKVVSPADWSQTLDVNQRGELAVSGYLVMKGYWGDTERTDSVLVPDEDGVLWMHTGDEALMDEEGYVKITGRIKDLIIKGGENIHPLEVENCLLGHSAVSNVSVVGLPCERYGEVVAAFIVRHEGAEGDVSSDEVRAWVRDKLSHHLGTCGMVFGNDGKLTDSGSAQIRLLGRQLPDNAQRKGAEVQVAGHGACDGAGGEGSGMSCTVNGNRVLCVYSRIKALKRFSIIRIKPMKHSVIRRSDIPSHTRTISELSSLYHFPPASPNNFTPKKTPTTTSGSTAKMRK
jgi:acyl-CoA synthetase (AMP-forming)/AMP-acid ligase II